jgi:hypothetical protein
MTRHTGTTHEEKIFNKLNELVDVLNGKSKARPHGVQEYKGSKFHSWEYVGPNSDYPEATRLRVPGGWIYRTPETGAAVFVPLPEVVGYVI